ncbi:sideroflexin-4 [Zootoca vivipara]|uniref:sideroflexin-4 n=1 Tax=Zootoca vivipara TaxID=8524 RepID=UPI00159085B0|nr:sideroflexin-4 [Zootoca vivipara]
MDLNWQFWRSEGQTFFQRFLHWVDILDATLLFIPNKDIPLSRALLPTSKENIAESLQDKKIREAWKLSLASVHPCTGETIPLLFRPPAFLPIYAPLVIVTLLPHRKAASAFICQFLFHSYIAGVTLANGNPPKQVEKKTTEMVFSQKQLLLSVGAITYASCMGALPVYFVTRYQLSPSGQRVFKNIIPGPLTALLCALNVMVTRSSEYENGIEVMDSQGQVIGMSVKAGEKAVEQTALTRGVMFGTAIFFPEVALQLLKRTSSLLRNPLVLNPLRSLLIVAVLGGMIPVSLSWMPPIGKIKTSDLEPEIAASTEETEVFYYKGL